MYQKRQAACLEVLRTLQQQHPGIHSFRDLTLPLVYSLVKEPPVRAQLEFIVEEHMRANVAATDLRTGNLAAFGRKLFQTHEGLRRKMQLSCPAIDGLVGHASGLKGVAGARMIGPGHGGCTVNLVAEDHLEQVWEQLYERHRQQTGLRLTASILETGPGAAVLNRPAVGQI
jgi:galactokinase